MHDSTVQKHIASTGSWAPLCPPAQTHISPLCLRGDTA